MDWPLLLIFYNIKILVPHTNQSFVFITLLQVCRNINQIKICMETGRKVILLNLENLYESLYDVLNQVTKPRN